MEIKRKSSFEETIKTEKGEIVLEEKAERKIDPEDERVLYQVTTNNIAYFKNMMLNVTYYSILLYGLIFFVAQRLEQQKYENYKSSIVLVAVSVLFFLFWYILKRFNQDIENERERIEKNFFRLFKLSLLEQEYDTEINEYKKRSKVIYVIYWLLNLIIAALYIVLAFI